MKKNMESASERLESLINNEKTGHLSFTNYSLKNIKFILKHFGNPHKYFKTIHIAGTNGKGSVAYMLNSILIHSGYKTGLFTSPHLLQINERIKINNKDIPNNMLNKYVAELFEFIEKNKKVAPTYFDALTLFAFRYFRDQNVDIAVIEVGLGGRLDSTNIIRPLVSIITDISLDHVNVLGKTIKEIAREKAGIIKNKTYCITSNSKGDAFKAISENADKKSAKLFTYNREFTSSNMIFKKDTAERIYDFEFKHFCKISGTDKKNESPYRINNISLKIAGKFQIINSSLAVAASILLNIKGIFISDDNIKIGLKKVKVPGRFQFLSKDPVIIFDPAHNFEAMKATISALKESYPEKKIISVLCFMADKDYTAMLELIQKEKMEKIFYYELNDKRCLKLSCKMDVKSKKNRYVFNNIHVTKNTADLARELKKNITNDTIIFITGSFRLYQIGRQLASLIKEND